jgi:hypothetical protein
MSILFKKKGGGTFSGSIANDQVAVGDGVDSIEGTSGLTYNGSALAVTGNITVTGTVDGIDLATIPDTNVVMQNLGAAAYTTYRNLRNTGHSTGTITGGTITDGGSGTVDITAGEVFIRSTNSELGELFSAPFSAVTGQALTDNSNNFIYVQYNSGTPNIVVSATPLADVHTNVVLGIIYRASSVVEITNVDIPTSQIGQLIAKRLTFVDGLTRQSGSITSETGTRNIAITAGLWWLALTEYSVGAFDSSGSDTWSYWYEDGSSGYTEVTTQTQIDNTQYDDSSGSLATLGNNRYGVHWVYQNITGAVDIVYGKGSYTLTAAEEASVPTAIPPFITGFHELLISKVIILKSASVFTDIQIPFSVQFNLGVASNHSDLGGLNADDHTQYLLADGTRALSGDLDLGTNDITNVGLVDGIDIATDVAANTTHISSDGKNHSDVVLNNTHRGLTNNPHSVAIADVSPLTTKGDVMAYSTVDARLGVGSNDQVLTADSAQTLGVKWGAVPFALCERAVSAADDETTSTTFQQKLRLTTSTLTSGSYRVTWYAEANSTDSGTPVELQIELDDTTTLGYAEVIPEGSGSSGYGMFSGFIYLDSTSGILEIDMDYKSGTSGKTVHIKNARLSIEEVAAP